VITRVERILQAGGATALVLMMAVVVVDVLGRNFFNRPLASGTEVTEMLMAAMAFLAFPLLALRQKEITVDLIDAATGPLVRRVQAAAAGLAAAGVFGLLSFQLGVFAQRALDNGETTAELQIPLTYLWWFMCAMAAATCAGALFVAARAATGQAAYAGGADHA
jgi:TRAP-type transport system small permease protein